MERCSNPFLREEKEREGKAKHERHGHQYYFTYSIIRDHVSGLIFFALRGGRFTGRISSV